MLDAFCAVVVGVAARFKDVVETDDIRFYIHVRVVDTVTHARLCREVDNNIEFVIREQFVNKRFICDRAFAEYEFARAVLRALIEFCEAIVLQRGVVIVVDVVDADNARLYVGGKQALDELRADEAGGAGY